MIVTYRFNVPGSEKLRLPSLACDSIPEAREKAANLAAKIGIDMYFPANDGAPVARLSDPEGVRVFMATVYPVSEEVLLPETLESVGVSLYSEARHAAEERRGENDRFDKAACEAARRRLFEEDAARLDMACSALGIDPGSVKTVAGGTRYAVYMNHAGQRVDTKVNTLRYILPGLNDLEFRVNGENGEWFFSFNKSKGSDEYPGKTPHFSYKYMRTLADLGELIEDIEAATAPVAMSASPAPDFEEGPFDA